MQFLEQLAQLTTEKIQLQIGITLENGVAVISVVPKTKDKSYTPFVLRGKPEELDDEFETALENLKAGLGIISNAAGYAATIQKEIENDKSEADKKAASKTTVPAKKIEPPKKEEKKAEVKPAAKKEEKKVEPDTSDEDDSLSLFADE